MTAFEEIKQGCNELGITVNALCLQAKIDRQIVQRWAKEDPKSIKIYNQIKSTISELKAVKSAEKMGE